MDLTNLKFTQERIDRIKQAYVDGRYPGLDVKDTARANGQLNGSYQTSNYPNAKYDYEDDNEDGLIDELEMVSTDPRTMQANYDYYFWTTFDHQKQSGTGQLEGSSHASTKNSFTGEYNTWAYEDLC
ncbi:hypothetical protein [Effusibacillus consociatus]